MGRLKVDGPGDSEPLLSRLQGRIEMLDRARAVNLAPPRLYIANLQEKSQMLHAQFEIQRAVFVFKRGVGYG